MICIINSKAFSNLNIYVRDIKNMKLDITQNTIIITFIIRVLSYAIVDVYESKESSTSKRISKNLLFPLKRV